MIGLDLGLKANFRSWILLPLFLMVMLFTSFNALSADGDRPNVVFNHDATNFPLRGLHTNTACENCHMNGVFKGTPTSCTQCHSRGGNSVAQMKPAKHIPITQDCNQCHRPNAWVPATFSHNQLTQTCATCHNNTLQTGKPSYHFTTIKDCGECHRTTAWLPASGYDHGLETTSSNCANSLCHDGRTATGSPANHSLFRSNGVSDLSKCGACHQIGTTFMIQNWSHNGVSIATMTDCKSCHSYTGSSSFGPSAYAYHLNISGKQCSDSGCHAPVSFMTWSNVTFDHNISLVTSHYPNCKDGCHNGNIATGVPSGASPFNHAIAPMNSSNCGLCHAIGTSFKPGSMDHAGAIDCKSCHTYAGNVFTPKPTFTHVNTSAQCGDGCHKTSTWYTADVNHSGFNASTNCALCHNGIQAVGTPAGSGILAHKQAPMTNSKCGACHAIGTTFVMSIWDHAGIATGKCKQCHTYSGNDVTPVFSNHVASSLECVSCHAGTTYTSWAGADPHKGVTVTSTCSQAGCHDGAAALAMPSGGSNKAHITGTVMTSLGCGACHAIGSSFVIVGWNHAQIGAATCSSCHTYQGNHQGSQFTPTFAGHLTPASGTDCKSCHSGFTTWANGKFTHAGLSSADTCTGSGCHDGSGATGYPLAPKVHIDVMLNPKCGSCHAIGTSFVMSTWNHAQITPGQCKTCHASYASPGFGAAGFNTHITTSLDCSSCHKAYSTWVGGKFTHQNLISSSTCSGAGCHVNGANSPPGMPTSGTYAHISVMATLPCGACHAIGTTFALTGWNHKPNGTVVTSCTSCHGSDGKSPGFNSAPYPSHVSFSSGTQCSTCHTGFTTWKGGAFSHTGISSGSTCTGSGCHDGVSAPGYPTGVKTHIDIMVNIKCGSCHQIGSTFVIASWNHAGIASGKCKQCHTNFSNPGFGIAGFPTHITTTLECGSCHSGYTSFTGGTYTHAGLTSASTCTGAGCHVNDSASIPYGMPTAGNKKHVSVMATLPCGSCHAIGSTFVIASWNHAQITAGQCKACHTSYSNPGFGTSPFASHIVSALDCSSCHKAYTTWAGGTYPHTGLSSADTCTGSGCHDGSSATGYPSGAKTHLDVMINTKCGACHAIGTTFALAGWNHKPNGFLVTNCTACHGTNGRSPGFNTPAYPSHIPFTSGTQCSSCHAGGYVTWAGGYFAHTSPVGTCTSCHNGSTATGVSASHPVPLNYGCESCHRTSAWAPAAFGHIGVTSGCNACHKLGFATFYNPATHMSGSGMPADCAACHTTSGWIPVTNYSHISPYYISHSGSHACSSCHNSHSTTYSSSNLAYMGSIAKGAVSTFNGAAQGNKGCAWCHSGQYSKGAHIKTQSPSRFNYSVDEVPDCSGSCHEYKTNNYIDSNIKTYRTGHHTTSSGSFN